MHRTNGREYSSCGLGFLALSLLLLSGMGCDGSGSSTPQKAFRTSEKVAIAVSKTPLSAPFFIAQNQGFFAAEGIQVKVREYVGGHRCLQAMLNGEAQMSTASDLPIMFHSFERNDYVVTTTFARSNNDVKILVRSDTGIASANDLRGRRVGAVVGASSQFFLDLFLLNNEVKPSEIELANLSPEQMPEALKNNQVDAISVWEPFGYETVKSMGANAVILPHLNIYEETFNLISLKSFAYGNVEKIRRVLLALERAIAFVNKKETEAQLILAEALGKDREFISWIWPDFKFELALDQSLIITLEDEARWAMKNRLVESRAIPNYLAFVFFDGLEKVAPEAITIIH